MNATKQKAVNSLIASFATLKSLADENKYFSPYQILQEFIKYIICEESLYAFSAIEMKNYLKQHFGFEIPEAVIKTAAKSTNGITLSNGMFRVSSTLQSTNLLFQEKKKEADDFSRVTINELSNYLTSRMPEATINEGILLEELLNFLTGDQSDTGKYCQLIGEFILKNEANEKIQIGLDSICEGSVIYLGLCHNINEIGSISKPLNLYLSTEILFSLFGYNGAIYKQLATDFYDQVRLANSGNTGKIHLYYFTETKKEIEDFFATAEDIVTGKKFDWYNKPAMKYITDGCTTAADVVVKKSDFFAILKTSYGILEDPTESYYEEEDFKSNLESLDFDDVTDEEDRKRKKEIGLKLISHINKLRRGATFNFYLESEHLIVTNTIAILQLSKEQTAIIKNEKGLDSIRGFAISLTRITSLLWYKLGAGFAKKSFPTSFSAVLKARTILSSTVARKAYKAFDDIKKQYQAGEIAEEQVAARICALRDMPKLPEDLQADNIDEALDFSSEHINRFEEQYKDTRDALKQKEALITSIKEEAAQVISEKDATIESQKEALQRKEDEKANLQSQLDKYISDEEKRLKAKMRRRNMILFAWSITWKLLVLIGIAAIAVFLENKYDIKITYILALVEAIGVSLSVMQFIKKDKDKYFGNKKDSMK